MKKLICIMISLLTGFSGGIFILQSGQFSIKDWTTLLGSTIGVLGAFLVAYFQILHDKKEKEKEKKPFVTLVNKNYENLEFFPGRLALNNSEKMSFNKKLCDLKLPIVNSGITPIHDAKIEYTSKEIDGTYQLYEQFFNKKENSNVWFENNDKFGKIVCIDFVNGKTKDKSYLPIEGQCFSKTIPVLRPNQTDNFELPMFALSVIQLLAFNDVDSDSKEELGKKYPYIEAKLSFKDYKNQCKEQRYYIKITRGKSRWKSDEVKITYSGTMEVYTEDEFLKGNKKPG
ncbi:hypothetical protein [Tetragenococcus halophilus]|uniref:hypothetical protein n=1 Tax=Tetragenococcus halophilus TaxID=51669 RepID=UPI002A9D336D|nr:hypothetical protein TEHSL10_10490 [Tetragenococcus halophilus]